jgi:hypothetical protein
MMNEGREFIANELQKVAEECGNETFSLRSCLSGGGRRKRSSTSGSCSPRVGFIVTNLEMPSRAVVRFYNKRGTAEQWIKEGKQAMKMTRMSCHRFRSNQVRLALSLLAYNLGNLNDRAVTDTDGIGGSWSGQHRNPSISWLGVRRGVAKVGHKWAILGCAADSRPSGVLPFHRDTNMRTGCTMVLFSRSKRKFRSTAL